MGLPTAYQKHGIKHILMEPGSPTQNAYIGSFNGTFRDECLNENWFESLEQAPRYLRSDNGPEFVSLALLRWAKDERLESVLNDPGKPWQNGTNESFNGKFRDECLAIEWFRNRLEAKVIIQDWWHNYNEIRPHSSLSYRTPAQFIAGLNINLSTETMTLS